MVPFEIRGDPFCHIEMTGMSASWSGMNPRTRYWTLHWLRVALWPLPVLTLLRAGRATANGVRRCF
jgi:hypothetical protein